MKYLRIRAQKLRVYQYVQVHTGVYKIVKKRGDWNMKLINAAAEKLKDIVAPASVDTCCACLDACKCTDPDACKVHM